MKSLLASFPFSNGLGMSLLLSRVKNFILGTLLQTKTADTAGFTLRAALTILTTVESEIVKFCEISL